MDDSIDPALIETSVDIRLPFDGGVDVLRQFDAVVEYSTETGYDQIGTVRGWIGWQIEGEDLYDAADAISADAEPLGAAAVAVIDAHPEAFIDNVLLIDRMHLDPKWRGNRLSGVIIADLLALLRLDAYSTVAVGDAERIASAIDPELADQPGRCTPAPGVSGSDGAKGDVSRPCRHHQEGLPDPPADVVVRRVRRGLRRIMGVAPIDKRTRSQLPRSLRSSRPLTRTPPPNPRPSRTPPWLRMRTAR